jgi:hypothetical protein
MSNGRKQFSLSAGLAILLASVVVAGAPAPCAAMDISTDGSTTVTMSGPVVSADCDTLETC